MKNLTIQQRAAIVVLCVSEVIFLMVAVIVGGWLWLLALACPFFIRHAWRTWAAENCRPKPSESSDEDIRLVGTPGGTSYDEAIRLANAALAEDATRSNQSLADMLGKPKRPQGAERKRLARIEFSYIDAEGEFSHRSVNVFAVDARRFEGYCHVAHATRTFLVERVQGDVVDLDTGEVLAPASWAKSLKKQTGGGAFVAVPAKSPVIEKPARRPAVHFTGFSADEKDELEAMADAAGFYVARSVVKDLAVLVTGDRASRKKIEDAEDIGAEVISRELFEIRC